MIKLFQPHVPTEVDKPLLDTLHSGYITQGAKVDEFEEKLARYLGNPYCVTVNSGTSALTIALRLADVGVGDEVITTAMTCTATNLPILSLGATPVFADVDPVTGLIDVKDVKMRITKNTKAIMCCDWGGAPADISTLLQVAKKAGIKVIEDAAHAFGANVAGSKVGAVADYTCFSFQAIKHITTVDGGLLTVQNKQDYQKARDLRWFGISRDSDGLESRIEQDIFEWGYKAHMNDVAATMGIVQLDFIEQIVAKHRSNASFYEQHLDPNIKFATSPYGDSASWLHTLLFPNKMMRNKFKDHLTKKNIQVSEVHRRNDEYTVFKPYVKDRLQGTTEFANKMLCIPVHWGLDPKELMYVADTINKYAGELRQWF